MIVRIFRSGISNGESPVNYVMDDSRAVKPELLEGTPQTTIDVINSIKRKHKYISGAIAFRNDENPTREQLHQVVDRFKETFCAGLSGDNFNSLFVLHRDKGNDEIHFVIPMQEMKSGKRLNIHPPGKRNLEFFESFVRVMNHSMGYTQVVPDPLKMGFSDFERKTSAGNNDRRQKGLAHDYIVKAIRAGKITNRNDLCHCIEEGLGLTITRKGSNYISVILPGAKKAKRLIGELYSENADYASLLAQSRDSRKPHFLSPHEYSQEQDKIKSFVDERRAFNTKAYLTPKPMRHRIPRTRFHRTTTIKREAIMEKPVAMTKGSAIQKIREMRSNSENRPASGTQISNGTTHSREDGITTQRDTTSSDNAFNGVKAATQSVSAAQLSLQGAVAQLANAKTPEQKAKAQQAVNEAQARVEKAQAQLAMAKIREANAPVRTATRRFK